MIILICFAIFCQNCRLCGVFFICVGLENIQMVIYVDVVTFCSCVDTNTEYQMF